MAKIKKIALITDTRFWQHGTGLWTRINALISFLQDKTELQIIFLGAISEADARQIAALGNKIEFSWLGTARKNKHTFWINQFKQANNVLADAYIVIRTENSFILDALPESSIKLVDTNDLISIRTTKRNRLKVKEHFPLTTEQEQQLLDQYDKVICIQKNEYHQVINWLGKEKTLYTPQPFSINPQSIREQVTNIGVIASEAPANMDGLSYFIQSVWPALKPTGVRLNIFGRACRYLQSNDQQIILHGFKKNLVECYQNIDIAINPVFYGAGLKIKSLEALAHGIPLVTSLEGASGIEDISGSGLLVATSPDEFAEFVKTLIDNKSSRIKLAENGLHYVQKHFNQDIAFQSLKEYLELA